MFYPSKAGQVPSKAGQVPSAAGWIDTVNPIQTRQFNETLMVQVTQRRMKIPLSKSQEHGCINKKSKDILQFGVWALDLVRQLADESIFR